MKSETASVTAGLLMVSLALLACGKKEESTVTTTAASATAAASAEEPQTADDDTSDSEAPTATAPKPVATAAPALKYVACPAGQVAAGTKNECLPVCTDSVPCKDDAETCEKSSFVSVDLTVKNVGACQPGGGIGARNMVPGKPWLNNQVPKDLAPAPAAPVSDFAQMGPSGCPKGFTNNTGGTCSRVCTTNANCHAPNKCTSLPVGTTKVCDEPGGA